MEVVDETVEGKYNTPKRKYISHNAIEMGAVWQTGYAKLPDYKKNRINNAFERDIARRANMAEDLGRVPMPRTSWSTFAS